MRNFCIGLLVSVALLVCAPLVWGQVRIVGAISGTVLDDSGSVIPGAAVQLSDELTGIEREAVTNASGAFMFPDLNHGSYRVTITLEGFRTAVYDNIAVESSRTTDLRVRLEVGTLDEAVTVTGASPVLERTSNAISNTLNNKAIRELPLPGRNAFLFARLMPGVTQPSGTGSTHFNGMPGGTINPTIDGINNSSNGWKSGGTSFFGTVPARLGAIEEVTVESAGLGGDAGVQGGVNLKFITKRGTNEYHGSLFEQLRNDSLNANTYFNTSRELEKPRLRRHDFGGNFGGPLLPSGALRDKLFFFINYEQEYIPQTQTRDNTILTLEAEQGIFRYQTATGEQRTANLLQIAAQNGFPSAPDPTIAALLAKQREAREVGTATSTTDLRTESLEWLEPQKQINYYPTARLDYQIWPNLSWMGNWSLYRQDAQGRRLWPFDDFPKQLDRFHSSWWIASTGLNWTMSPNTHNELRYGVQHSGDTIPGRELEFYRLNGTVNGLPARFQLPLDLSNLSNDAAPITGRHYITTIFDTVTLLRGNHSVKFGGNFRRTEWRDTSFDGPGTAGFLGLPRYDIGSPAGDPVQSTFNATTLPGIQDQDLGDVYALYALMTGRLSQVQTGKILDPETLQYSDTAYRENWTSSWFGGLFVQDSWRINPKLTLNYGLRWEVSATPFSHFGTAVFPDVANLLGPSTAPFQPGVLDGVANPVMTRGKHAAGTDWVNPAPRVGFAWTPELGEDGILAKLLGSGPDTVIRGGYDITYYDEGTNMFAFTAGDNPGQSQSLLLSPGAPGFAPGGLSLQDPLPPFVAFPLEFSDVFNQSDFTFGTTDIATMDDDLRMPSVQAWNVGIQRQIMENTVVELRYMGNKGSNVWHTYDNLNEVNIFENGFLQEFENAQRNLAISQAAGVDSFANRGLPGQVPLPILEAAFGGRGSQDALPDGEGFTNGGFITSLQQGEAGRLASNLAGNQNYICRMVGNAFVPCADRGYSSPGPYPANFFQANPYAIGGDLRLVDDDSSTKYHALQVQLRRRYHQGLSMNVNYTWSKNTSDLWADNSTQDHTFRTLRDKSLDEGPSPFDLRHTLQMFGTYDLPFGKDRHFAINNGLLDAIVGGWTLGGILTAQSGTPFRLSSGRLTVNGPDDTGWDSGVVLQNGLTLDELQDMVKVGPGPGLNRIWIDPQLIGPDGRANPEFLAPPTTPGEFGQFIWLRTPNTWNLDASLNKRVRLPRGAALTIHITATNVLNHPVWTIGPEEGGAGLNYLVDANITSTNFGQTARPRNDPRELYVRAEVSF